MPDVLTHAVFGEEVISYLKENEEANSRLVQELEERIDLIVIGAQGPDLFFYHNFRPWERGSLNKLGGRLHREKTGQFFIKGFCYLKQLTQENPGDVQDNNLEEAFNLLAYLCGFLCHFCLDKNAHPFIYYFTGYEFNKGEERGKHSRQHQELEAIIDKILVERKKGLQAHQITIFTMFQKSGLPPVIGEFYRDVLSQLFDLEISPREINKAYQDMGTAMRLIYDPWNIKKLFLNNLCKLTGKKLRLPRPFHPCKVEEDIDYLNEVKKKWHHPLNEMEDFESSFMDIFEESIVEASRLISDILHYFQGNTDNLDDFLDDLSYLTNKKWGTAEAFKYSKGSGILKL